VGTILMDAYGLFYELQTRENPGGYAIGGLQPRPISQSFGAINDFTPFRGMIAMGLAGSTTFPGSPSRTDTRSGQARSGLTFVKPQDLWKFGKPEGWGGVWNGTSVGAGETSDPFLINGFDKKTIHLETDAATDYTIQVDPIGDGSWKDYDTVSFGGAGYDAYIMTGDAVWVRVKSSDAVTATAWFNVR